MSCPDSIEAALLEQPGVHNVEIDLATDGFTVFYDPALIRPEQMLEVIEKTGFHPYPIKSS